MYANLVLLFLLFCNELGACGRGSNQRERKESRVAMENVNMGLGREDELLGEGGSTNNQDL